MISIELIVYIADEIDLAEYRETIPEIVFADSVEDIQNIKISQHYIRRNATSVRN